MLCCVVLLVVIVVATSCIKINALKPRETRAKKKELMKLWWRWQNTTYKSNFNDLTQYYGDDDDDDDNNARRADRPTDERACSCTRSGTGSGAAELALRNEHVREGERHL